MNNFVVGVWSEFIILNLGVSWCICAKDLRSNQDLKKAFYLEKNDKLKK